MTIIEAVKTGKPFRRRGRVEYYLIDDHGLRPFDGRPYGYIPLGEADLLADDWEVKREKVKKTGLVFRPHIQYIGLAEIDRDESHINPALRMVKVTWEEEE